MYPRPPVIVLNEVIANFFSPELTEEKSTKVFISSERTAHKNRCVHKQFPFVVVPFEMWTFYAVPTGTVHRTENERERKFFTEQQNSKWFAEKNVEIKSHLRAKYLAFHEYISRGKREV